ncbi:MAG TPA: NAD(P)/FAD-dependent oxidoreductase [Patescibacteria group bacterium]|nr:NAD(P)/FAD-dependent oxidoreductase [Patescibacteria group bacterium]
MVEVAIVGAGPSGLIAARDLARLGVSVTVYEEHTAIGEPNHCAGILSVEGLERLDVEPSPEFLQHEVRGGTAYSPNGTPLRIKGDRTRAYIVDRAAFDRGLADSALDAGAEIRTGCRVTGLTVKGGRVQGVQGPSGAEEAQVVIDCEGVSGTLARQLGFQTLRDGVLAGVNVGISEVEVETNMVEVWMGGFASGLFAWTVPTGDSSLRCGLAYSGGDPAERLRGFLRRRFGEVEPPDPKVWPVLTGGPVERTFGEGLLLVGDVAGQVKPTTGGGVIMGGICARMAAETAVEALEAGDASSVVLGRYEARWRKELESEFNAMLRARRFANRISDDRLDRLFASVGDAGLEERLKHLVEGGDMDMQSRVLRAALTDPQLVGVVARSLGTMLYRELVALFP